MLFKDVPKRTVIIKATTVFTKSMVITPLVLNGALLNNVNALLVLSQ